MSTLKQIAGKKPLKTERVWFAILSLIVISTVLSSFCFLCGPADAQKPVRMRALDCEFHPEQGAPVQVTNLRCSLELDPFGAPTASRIYITYKNISNRTLTAVKFRCRYTDAENKDKGTFHAPDSGIVAPGQTKTQKWRREKSLNPTIVKLKVRVLTSKAQDGAIWESVRMRQLEHPPNQPGR